MLFRHAVDNMLVCSLTFSCSVLTISCLDNCDAFSAKIPLFRFDRRCCVSGALANASVMREYEETVRGRGRRARAMHKRVERHRR